MFLAFTTANAQEYAPAREIGAMRALAEGRIDLLFQAAAEATQEAVLDALAAAVTTRGRGGHRRRGLAEILAAGID